MKQEEKERAGALTGAQIGTAVIPIPAIGTFMGALVGGVVSSEGTVPIFRHLSHTRHEYARRDPGRRSLYPPGSDHGS